MTEYENRLIFKNYEYFMAIIEEGGISKAADKLFISQSSVSKYLKRLEDNIGITLFSRESYPLSLTGAGELYFKYVKEIFAMEKEFRNRIAEQREGARGVVKVGVAFFHSSIFFPVILPEFSRRYPNIHIEAHEGTSQDMIAMLEHGKVDFAIFQLPSSYSDIVFEHLVYEPILFAVNKTNPLLQSISYDPEREINHMGNEDFLRFRNEFFVLMKAGQNSRMLAQLYCNKLHFKPNIALETWNVSTVVNMVKAGMGVAFIPGAVLNLKEQTKGLLFFQVDDPPLQRELGIAYKSTNTPGRQATLFIGTLKELIHD
jgi:DNA-binding transcriptional LysR family regulator